MGIHFNWQPDEPKVDDWTLRIFRRAVFRARYHNRLHEWENLPREEDPIDAEIPDAIDWQDFSTIEMIQSEHKMTLACCFMAIGVERPLAEAIVEYIIAKEK